MDEMNLLMARLAVIRRISELAPDAGKMSVQKIVYFIQNWLEVPLDYRFKMHHYGPYSVKVDGNLSLASAMGLVNLDRDPDGFGYHVTPGIYELENVDAELPWENVDGLIEVLGDLELSRLELLASTHFVKCVHPKWNKAEIIDMVRRVKPKFRKSEIEKSYADVFEQGLQI